MAFLQVQAEFPCTTNPQSTTNRFMPTCSFLMVRSGSHCSLEPAVACLPLPLFLECTSALLLVALAMTCVVCVFAWWHSYRRHHNMNAHVSVCECRSWPLQYGYPNLECVHCHCAVWSLARGIVLCAKCPHWPGCLWAAISNITKTVSCGCAALPSLHSHSFALCVLCLRGDSSSSTLLSQWPRLFSDVCRATEDTYTKPKHRREAWPCTGTFIRSRYHGGRQPSSGNNFHSPTVIPPSALDKSSIMKRYHHQRTTRWGVTARSPMMVTLHDTRFVEWRWWNDGWTVKTVVTWWLSASMILAPDHDLAVSATARLRIGP